MADATGVLVTLPTKIGGINATNGIPDYFADVTSLGQLKVFDSSNGPVTPGSSALTSSLSGGQYNTVLPTLSNTNQAALQLDGSGRLIVTTSGTSLGIADESAFTYGTTIQQVIGGVYQDTSPTLSSGQQGAVRLTQYRGFHTNLRSSLGVEISSSSNGYAAQQLLNVQVPNTTVAPVNLGALNASVSIAMAGLQTVGFQMGAGTFIGTVTPQCSLDNGTNWVTCSFLNPTNGAITSSYSFTSSNPLTVLGIVPLGGSTNVRVLVTSYTSGTASCILSSSQALASTTQPGSMTGSGTITALNGSVVATTAGFGSSFFDITGTWVGTITFQAQNGDGIWFNIFVFFASTGSYASNNTTVNTTVQLNCAGYSQVRAVSTAWTSGTATVSWNAAAYPHQIQIYNPSSPANVLVNSYGLDGNGNILGSSAGSGASLFTIKPDSSITGTLGALNAVLNLPINDVSSAYALISGTWVGTIQFQGSVNGSTFVPLEAVQGGPTNAYSTAGFTSNGGVRIALPAGFTSIQAVMMAYTSGTATVVINASQAVSNAEAIQFNAANLNATVVQGTSPWITKGLADGSVSGGTAGTFSALIGGIYNSVAPSLSSGNQASLQLDNAGNLKITGTVTALDASIGVVGSAPPTSAGYMGALVSTASPSYSNGVMEPPSLTLAGALRVDGSATTQPVSGTVTAKLQDGSGTSISSQFNGLNVNTKTVLKYSAPTTALVNTTSTLILAANSARLGLYLSNTTGNQQISFGFDGNAAVYQNGITLYPGEKFWMDEYSFSTGAVYAITVTATTYIGIQEITH